MSKRQPAAAGMNPTPATKMRHSFASFSIPEEIPYPTPTQEQEVPTKWERHRTDVSYSLLIVQRHIGAKTGVASRLLVDIIPKLEYSKQDKCRLVTQSVLDELKHRILLMTSRSQDVEIQMKQKALCEMISQSYPNLWFLKRRDMLNNLDKYMRKNFHDAFVECLSCNKFSKRLVFKVDIKFMGEEFLAQNEDSIKKFSELKIRQADAIEGRNKLPQEANMGGAMCWVREEDATSVTYGGPSYLAKFFYNNLIPGVLREFGEAIPPGTPDEVIGSLISEHKALGYLYTKRSQLQTAHTDVSHKSIEKLVSILRRKRVDDITMPFSFDLPLNPRGLRLAVWGTQYPQSKEEPFYTTPIDVHVFGGEILLWRCDMIHGGCLPDPTGQLGAFRQHGFLPLNKEHVPMYVYAGSKTSGSLNHKSRNRNPNPYGAPIDKNYDCFLLGFAGEEFQHTK